MKLFSNKMTEVTFKTTNPELLTKIVNSIGNCGNGGHTFDILIDPENEFGKYQWDGDGSDRVEVTEDKTFSDREKVSAEMLEKAQEDGVVQKKPNGKWGIISIDAGEWWNADYNTKESAENALKAYHANKGFSTLPIENDPSIIHRDNSNNMSSDKIYQEIPQITADWTLNKPFNISIEPWLVTTVINDKTDGLYLGKLIGDSIEVGKDTIKLDVKVGDSVPHNVFVLVKSGKAIIFKMDQLCKSINKTFSDNDKDYSFDLMPTEKVYDMQHLIGSWMMASSIIHLFHVCDRKFAGHVALDDFYKEFPEKIDALAEHFLAENDKAEFRICIVPKGCPIEYLEELLEFTKNYCKVNEVPSAYQSQIDDIINCAQSTLYKLKRLDSGRRVFTILPENVRYYVVKIGDDIKVLGNQSIMKYIRPWEVYRNGEGEKPDFPRPSILFQDKSKTKCNNYKNKLIKD